MDINTQRQVTEADVQHVEDALSEFEASGSTERKCPWCAHNLKFEIGTSGYRVCCSNCSFKISVRGI